MKDREASNTIIICFLCALATISAAGISHAEDTDGNQVETITLKLIDSQGKSVEAAQVGDRGGFLEIAPGCLWLDWGYSNLDRTLSNESGIVEIPKDKLFPKESIDNVSLYVVQERRRIGAIVEIDRETTRREIKLEPLCIVQGTATSEQIEKLKRLGRQCSVYVKSQSQIQLSDSNWFLSWKDDDGGQFTFLLPPGQYQLFACVNGSGRERKTYKKIEIPEGKAQLDAGRIEAPLTMIDSLIEKQPLEIDSVEQWLQGEPVKLADLKGKAVIVTFMCHPANRVFKELLELNDNYGQKGLEIIDIVAPVNTTIEALNESLDKYRDRMGGTFGFAIDGGPGQVIKGLHIPGDSIKNYEINKTPTMILINPDGLVEGELDLIRANMQIGWMLDPDLPAERKKFHEIYRLEEGQVLKHIDKSDGKARYEFYWTTSASEWRLNEPEAMILEWDGRLKTDGLICQPEYSDTLRTLIAKVLFNLSDDHPEHEYDVDSIGWMLKVGEGPDWKRRKTSVFDTNGLLYTKVDGDWIVRTDASVEAKARALEEIIARDFGLHIRLKKHTIERDVVVVSGRFRFEPAFREKGYSKSIRILTGRDDTFLIRDQCEGWLGNLLDIPFVDESGAPCEINLKDCFVTISEDTFDEAKREKTLETILENLSRQTGQTYRIERRNVDVWFLSEDVD